MPEILKVRLKSLAWRVGMMGLVAIVAFAIDNASLLSLPSWTVVILGLVMGEISKYLNTNI